MGKFAKIFGYLFAAASTLPLAIQNATPAGQAQPHGALQWITAVGGWLAAFGIHAASNSGPESN